MAEDPKLTSEQLEQLDSVIAEARSDNIGEVSFPHVAAGVAGIVAAGITAVLVARDLGARAVGDYDPTKIDDMSKLLIEEAKAGRMEDIPLDRLVELRQRFGMS